MAMALAASSTEPPPTATTTSAARSRASANPALTSSKVGSPQMATRPMTGRDACSSATRSAWEPLTSRTRCPSPATRSGKPRACPAPNRIMAGEEKLKEIMTGQPNFDAGPGSKP